MKTSFRLFTGALALSAAGLLAGCPQAPNQVTAIISLTANPARIAADGTTTTITIQAVDSQGNPGSGTVNISANAGAFRGAGTSAIVTLAQGRATATYACDVTADSTCVNSMSVNAIWNGIGGNTTIALTSPVHQPPDSGTPDSGTPDSGTPDSGTPDAGQPDSGIPDSGTADSGTPDSGVITGSLQLGVSKSKIYIAVGDSSTVTAATKYTDGGAEPNIDVTLSTNLGKFKYADGGGGTTAAFNTGSTGVGSAVFTETGDAGTATITGTASNGGSATTSVQVIAVQSISYVGTVCATGNNCSLMGVHNSGFNESAQVSFVVKDSNNNPVSGINVTFNLNNAPTGTTVTSAPVTSDANGLVTAVVSSGNTIGAFNVHAVVFAGTVETTSPTIGIGGGIPSNTGLTLKCTPVNQPALVGASPPAAVNVTCNLTLVDRFSHPVGTGTSVNLLTEAGYVTDQVSTVKFNPTGTNDTEGTGSFTFKSNGGSNLFPADVVPLLADPTQTFPFPRTNPEPSWTYSGTTYNPRDGLITVVAYVQGEEWYDDANQDGIWDNNEQFVDQGEPFVDYNDNGVRDQGEPYIDVNGNGRWDPPNGTHDSNATIWTEAHILYTGLVDSRTSQIIAQPDFLTPCTSGGGVAKGGSSPLVLFGADTNMNRPTGGSSVSVSMQSGGKGSVGWPSGAAPLYVDDYGFQIDRRLVDPDGGTACVPTTRICQWKTVFGSFGRGGVSSDAMVFGAATSDTTPCQMDTVFVNFSVVGLTTTLGIQGYVQ